MHANHLFRGLFAFPVTASRPILLLALGWHLSATPVAANIGTASLTATSSTSAVLSFSHTGFQANPFPLGIAQGWKYRVCWRQLNQIGLACMYNPVNTNGAVQLTGLTVGLPINITIQCWCRKQLSGNFYGPSADRVVSNMNYTHQLPPPPQPVPGLVSSTNVRVRGALSGQCLFMDTSNSRVRGWDCWADPAMVFALETFSDGTKRLRNVQTGLCITALGSQTPVFAVPCGDYGAKLAITPSGPGGAVLARFIFGYIQGQTGTTCLMANSVTGQNATRQNCSVPGAALHLILDPA